MFGLLIANTGSVNAGDMTTDPSSAGSVRFTLNAEPDARTGPVGRYYPERAQRFGVSGAARIECTLGVKNTLNACHAVAEVPLGYNFGDAAVAMATRRAIKYLQPHADPEVAEGRVVAVDVPFQLPR